MAGAAGFRVRVCRGSGWGARDGRGAGDVRASVWLQVRGAGAGSGRRVRWLQRRAARALGLPPATPASRLALRTADGTLLPLTEPLDLVQPGDIITVDAINDDWTICQHDETESNESVEYTYTPLEAAANDPDHVARKRRRLSPARSNGQEGWNGGPVPCAIGDVTDCPSADGGVGEEWGGAGDAGAQPALARLKERALHVLEQVAARQAGRGADLSPRRPAPAPAPRRRRVRRRRALAAAPPAPPPHYNSEDGSGTAGCESEAQGAAPAREGDDTSGHELVSRSRVAGTSPRRVLALPH